MSNSLQQDKRRRNQAESSESPSWCGWLEWPLLPLGVPSSSFHCEWQELGVRISYINSGPSHLICMTHMRHVGPKRVTHRFPYTTYVFNRTMHWKNMNNAYRSKLHIKIRTLHIKIRTWITIVTIATSKLLLKLNSFNSHLTYNNPMKAKHIQFLIQNCNYIEICSEPWPNYTRV
jgi:hypothetical protein